MAKTPRTDMLDAALCRTLGNNVGRIRAQRRLTQAEVAKASGIPRTAISEIESGQKNITLTTGRRLASALGTTLQNLLA